MEVKSKKGVVDQILLWMTLLVAFVGMFFLIVDYSAISRIKSNMDQMTQYAARMIALNKDHTDIASSMNSMKVNYFADITADDINCIEIAGGNEYQVVLTLTSTYTQSNILNFANTIESKIATFNETSAKSINCTLNLTEK